MTRREHREAGFTLLELLVALVLIGLVSVLATGLLRFSADGERRLADRADRIEDRIALERRLRREMNAVLPLLDYDADRPESSFSGDGKSLRFLAATANGPRRRAFSISETGEVRLEEGRFAEAVAHFEANPGHFTYFGLKRSANEPAWHKSWHGELSPPSLVRLSLESGAELVVPVPAERADQ